MLTIRQLETKYSEKLAPKVGLTDSELESLKEVFGIVINAIDFFEEEINVDDQRTSSILHHIKTYDNEYVAIDDGKGNPFYEIADFLIHSVFYNKNGDIILTAYLKKFYGSSGNAFLPENLTYFLISGEDEGLVTASFCDAFALDVGLPTVSI